MTQWIEVSDRLPLEEEGEVLVRMRDGQHEIAWATYWMTIPPLEGGT